MPLNLNPPANPDFFKGINQLEFTKDGNSYKQPFFYFDNLSMTAVYTASSREVKKHLPHPKMKPIEVMPGRCLVAFTGFEYRKTDFDPYNEFSISVMVAFDRLQIPPITAVRMLLTKTFPIWVWHLPVNTEIANTRGIELYGYPKFVANVDFQKHPDRVCCDLSMNGKQIASLTGKVLPVKQGRQMRYISHTMKNGTPLFINVFVNPVQFAQARLGNHAELSIGEGHPICDELKSIDLSKKPLVYQYSPVNQAIQFPARNRIDV